MPLIESQIDSVTRLATCFLGCRTDRNLSRDSETAEHLMFGLLAFQKRSAHDSALQELLGGGRNLSSDLPSEDSMGGRPDVDQ